MDGLIGIDIGTTGAKTCLFDSAGRTIARAFAEYPLHHPKPGWAEQETEDWWQATILSLRAVIQQSGVDPAAITAIGLSGQMHGAVLLDRSLQVLRPSIIWCDQRTAQQCDWITETVGKERLLSLVSNPALPGFTAPKVIWVRDNEPEIYERIHRVVLPKDYIRYRLTGEVAMEVSDAAGTLFFDVRHRRWSDELLAAIGIPREWMPACYESIDVCGQITQAVADETGLRAGTPVVAGGADNTCGAVGNGIVREGLVSSSIGTSGVVFAHTDRMRMDAAGRAHTFNHSVPDRWYMMGVAQASGLSLRWFRDTFGAAEMEVGGHTGLDPYHLMALEAARAPAGSEGLLFLPYLQGERTPHLDANARGVFFGLTPRHGREHMIRAIMEGVAYSLRDAFAIIREQGTAVEQVRATGGGARSALWRQIQADVFGVELVTVNASEGPAFGAALLAGVGAGVYPSVEEACARTIRVVERTAPNPAAAAVYDEYYAIFGELYPALKTSFGRVSATVARLSE